MHCRIIAFVATIAAGILATPHVVRAQSEQPAVAILGLEVIDDGAGIDAETAKLAVDLTEALRRRASVSGAGPYRLAPNSGKDLLEMKLLSNCTNEARSCMAAIGKELGASWLMYGKIERRRDGYQVTLKLLNVETKSMERTTTELIQLDQATAGLITNWAGKLYNRLTGVPDQGSLEITANVSTGKVYVDNELKGGLASNTIRIDGIASGTHQVRVEAEGHEPLLIEVDIEGGKTLTEELQLQIKSVGTSVGNGGDGDVDHGGRPGGGYRVAFWTGAVLTAASGAGIGITWTQVKGLEDDKLDAINAWHTENPEMPLEQGDACGDAQAKGARAVADICDRGEARAKLTNVFWVATGVTAIATGFFFYKGYLGSDSSSSMQAATSSSKPRTPTVQITPALDPSYVGARVRLEF